MRGLVIPVLTTILVVGAMVEQARTVEPVLCDAPSVRLPEIPGYWSERFEPSEAELTVLPADTVFDKRRYRDADGNEFSVSAVIGGKSKGSIHRPELCLPAQGFQMTAPHRLEVGGIDWHAVRLERRDAPAMGFAYTFFNQEGFQTSSHVVRIFRDVLDRSFRGRIDRWVMVTVHASSADDSRLAGFLAHLKGVLP